MNLQELKDSLQQRDEITFVLPSGEYVPPHFHVTEVGKSSKLYVDCGGTVQQKKSSLFSFGVQMTTITEFSLKRFFK